MKACPFCAEDIKNAAIVCKHCGRDLPKESVELAAKRAKQAKQSSQARWAVALVLLLFFFIGLPVIWRIEDNQSSVVTPAENTSTAATNTCVDGVFGESKFSCTTGPDGTVFQFAPPLRGDDAVVLAAMRTVLAQGMNVDLSNASTRETGASIRFIAGGGVYDLVPAADERGRLVGLVVMRPR